MKTISSIILCVVEWVCDEVDDVYYCVYVSLVYSCLQASFSRDA